MEKASELLRRNGIEINFGDHRTPEEIVQALGLAALQPEESIHLVANETDVEQKPVERAHRIERRESRPYFA